MAANLTLVPTESEVFAALRATLLGFLPSGVEVVRGQVNRVPEPKPGNHVVMWLLLSKRLATNLDEFVDSVFTASIAGGVMTVTAVDPDLDGEIVNGATIFGTGVADGTVVVSRGTGTGGVGTYNVTPEQTVASEKMAAGREELTQHYELHVQVDVHGPAAANNAQTLTTLLRDARGVDAMTAVNPRVCPLHADDPVQGAFVNDQNQYEDCWHVTAHLQVNQTLGVPQQFADTLAVTGVIEIDAAYPPT